MGGAQLVGKVSTETAAAAYATGCKAESCELEGRADPFTGGTGQQHQRKDATLIEPHKIDGILITQSKQKALARTEKNKTQTAFIMQKERTQ